MRWAWRCESALSGAVRPLLLAKDLGADAAASRALHPPVQTALAVPVRRSQIVIFLNDWGLKLIIIISNEAL